MDQDVAPLANFVGASISVPACFLGSGGSLSSATYGAYLHQQSTSQVAEAVTPLEFSARPKLESSAVVIMSAGQKKRDILSAFRNAVARDTRRLGVICFDPKSALTSLAKKVWSAELLASRLPSGRDGFLATNSLLAFFILIMRGYSEAGLLKGGLPKDAETVRAEVTWSEQELVKALSRRYLIVLFGPHTRAAAVDLESKLSEAALGAVQLADFRNFAHGRHHWIAKATVHFVDPGRRLNFCGYGVYMHWQSMGAF